MTQPIESIASQGELAALSVVVVLVALGGALWARTRAPQVAAALITGLATGAAVLWLDSQDGLRGAPLVAIVAASTALVVSGFVMVWLLPDAVPKASLRRAVRVTLIAAPLAGVAALVAIQDACPPYVTQGAGACYYRDDVLGGWSTAAAITIALDFVLVAAMMMVLDHRARRLMAVERRPGTNRDGEDSLLVGADGLEPPSGGS